MNNVTNVLDTFDPIIFIEEKDNVTAVTFDSNFRNDLNRGPKLIFLKHNYFHKGCSLSITLEEINITEEKNGMQLVDAIVHLNAKSSSPDDEEKIILHKMNLALPAIAKNGDNFQYLNLFDITVDLKDRLADSVSSAMESHVRSDFVQNENAVQSTQIAALNPWNQVNQDQNDFFLQDKKPSNTILSLFKMWPVWKKATFSMVCLLVLFSLAINIKGLIFTNSSVNTAVAKEFKNNPEAIDAQVNLTRETLKGMGLDPTNVQNDLGCLAK